MKRSGVSNLTIFDDTCVTMNGSIGILRGPVQHPTRFADYFVICGLDKDSGLEPDKYFGESEYTFKTQRCTRTCLLSLSSSRVKNFTREDWFFYYGFYEKEKEKSLHNLRNEGRLRKRSLAVYTVAESVLTEL